MSQNTDLWPRFEGEFGGKLFGGLGLLQFPEVPWAPSFNTGGIAHGALIHDQFPSGEISPFESTGRAVTSGRICYRKRSLNFSSMGRSSCRKLGQLGIRGPVLGCGDSFAEGRSVG